MKRFTAGLCVLALVISPISAQENSKDNESCGRAGNERGKPARSPRGCRYGAWCFTKTAWDISSIWGACADQDVHVDFTSAQLNDVLKSLTCSFFPAANSGSGFKQRSAAARRWRRCAWHRRTTDRGEFLGALRGARVEIRSGAGAAKLPGSLLSVERKNADGDRRSVEMEQVSSDHPTR